LRAQAEVTYTTTTFEDTFLATGSPDNPAGTNLTGLNYGAAGILVVAPSNSVNGEFQSVLGFDLSGAPSLFNTTYGSNNWSVTGITLQLTSNYGGTGEIPDNPLFPPIHGGRFVIEWLSNNDWIEGTGRPKQPTTDGVTYDLLPYLLSGPHNILCTNTYNPPGDNVPVIYSLPLETNLVNEISQGGDATLLFYAADNQIAYLFNSYNSGGTNVPFINISANETPPKIVAAYFTNANFHISGLGVPIGHYGIQANTDLITTNWQLLGTVTADGSGNIQFDDTLASGRTQCFYRISR
jgi:hypothetical protein